MASLYYTHKTLRGAHRHVISVKLRSPEVTTLAKRLGREVNAIVRKYKPTITKAAAKAKASAKRK
jgi:hypothetical protein